MIMTKSDAYRVIASHIYVASAHDQKVIILANSIDEATRKAEDFFTTYPITVNYLRETKYENTFVF